jgi:hypothetical protein
MGRGRAKAKQTKVARDLKYQRFDTDFDQLQRELHGQTAQAEQDGDTDDADGDPHAGPHDDADPAQRS